jgi:hypothetical protein
LRKDERIVQQDEELVKQDEKLAEFENRELEVAKLDEDENVTDEDGLDEDGNEEALDEKMEETETTTPLEASKKAVVDDKAVSKVQEQLREHIAENYRHPANNIIVCGIPPIVNANPTKPKPNSELVRIDEKYCADKDGVVYEMPIPNFISKLFGDALKVEVGK